MKDVPTISLAELSNPHHLIKTFGGSPVAVTNGQEVIGYFVPNHAVHEVSVIQASENQLREFLDKKLVDLKKNLEYLKSK